MTPFGSTKWVNANDRNAYPFTPFHGTPLRAECERLGLMNYEDISRSLVVGIDDSPLDMPQFPLERVQAIIKTFNMYVKFDESRWPEIKKAEEDTPEGQKVYEKLKAEFVERFWNEDDQNFEAAAMGKTASASTV